MTNKEEIKTQWFKALLKAKKERRSIDSPSSAFGAISVEDAYDVQDMLIKHMLEKDERIVGWKVGATSHAVMEQLKIKEPFLGCMTSRSEFSFLKEIKSSHFCKLAVEGEIVFVAEIGNKYFISRSSCKWNPTHWKLANNTSYFIT